MQAIVTKYISPTNHLGGRIKATCQARSLTLGWDHALSPSGNHRAAAQTLATQLGWAGRWTAGGLPDGSTAWVTGWNDIADTFTVYPGDGRYAATEKKAGAGYSVWP